MKKVIIASLMMALPLTGFAQMQQSYRGSITQQNDKAGTFRMDKKDGWFNNLELGITGGTSGIGFDLGTPMTEWTRLRVGGVFRPLKNYRAKFGMEVSEGLSKELSASRFQELSDKVHQMTGIRPYDHVWMEGDLSMNNFKMLVDVFPFKNNKHWHFTVGFYYGNHQLIEAKNSAESMNTLITIGMFNNMYKRALANRNPVDISDIPVTMDSYIRMLRKWGSTSNDANGNPKIKTEKYTYNYEYEDYGSMVPATGQFEVQRGSFSENALTLPIGYYAHDVVAQEDVYYNYSEKLYKEGPSAEDIAGQFNITDMDGNPMDPSSDEFHYVKDANGRYIKEGNIRYKKGEVMHQEGETFRMVADEENIVKAQAKVNKFKPYVGVGYEMALPKDSRIHVAVDAGVMFWGGHPSVDIRTPIGVNANGETIYMSYDLSRDVQDLRGSLRSYVKSVKKYPVFPEVSLRVSYKIF